MKSCAECLIHILQQICKEKDSRNTNKSGSGILFHHPFPQREKQIMFNNELIQ